MMTMIFAPILAMTMGLSGSAGNHFLDYASTEFYWKGKGVAVSMDNMVKEIALAPAENVGELIKDLGSADPQTREQASRKLLQKGTPVLPQLREAAKSPDPETAAAVNAIIEQINLSAKAASVRRLMAIRTLGEMKKKEALPALKALVESKDAFVGEYAQRAIAGIEGMKYSSPPVPEPRRKTDVSLLPAESCIVAQHAAFGRAPVTIDQIMANLPAMPGFDKNEALGEISKNVIEVAEQVGDLRLDMATAAVAGDVGPDTGWAAVVFFGQYDSAAARAALRKVNVKSKQVGKLEVFSTDDHMALICPSDDRVVLMTGASADKLPLDSMVAALSTGKGTLANAKEMVKLIDSIDTTQPAWGVAKITDSYRVVPVVNALDTATAVLSFKDDRVNLTVKAEGSNPQRLKDAVDFLNNGVQEAINQVRKAAPNDAQMVKPILDVLESIKCTAEGRSATLTASMQADVSALLSGFAGMFRAEMGPPQPVPAPPPPVPQKQ